jgi:hypothetical protein
VVLELGASWTDYTTHLTLTPQAKMPMVVEAEAHSERNTKLHIINCIFEKSKLQKERSTFL